MVLGVGLVSAIIISKKRSSYKTRLEKLSQNLKEKPITSQKFKQLPVRKLFIMLFITAFMAFFAYFEQAYEFELI